MGVFLRTLIEKFSKDSRAGLQRNIAITWICYEGSNSNSWNSGIGAGWLEETLFYPASVVKLFYGCAIETWLHKDLLVDCSEIRRAMAEMIVHSSNDATGYLVDLLTATTSGPALNGKNWEVWKKQRNWINDWLNSFDWEEFCSINCCQKTWNDGPFGREKDFYGKSLQNRNALSTIATARLLESIMNDSLLTAKSTKDLKKLLFRSLDLVERKADSDNQVDGFLGEGLPIGTKLWSKAGLMSEARNDAACFITPNNIKMLLIVFTQGQKLANDVSLLPAIAAELSKWKSKEKTLSP